MNKEILIVDDNKNFLNGLTWSVSNKGYIPLSYQNFYDALDFVKKREAGFYACFVDMKPIDNIPNVIDRETKNLLEVPEEIFEIVKIKSLCDKFYFTSGHFSEHDEIVLKKTKANFILKENILDFFKI